VVLNLRTKANSFKQVLIGFLNLLNANNKITAVRIMPLFWRAWNHRSNIIFEKCDPLINNSVVPGVNSLKL
jgi:hypothetical protein